MSQVSTQPEMTLDLAHGQNAFDSQSGANRLQTMWIQPIMGDRTVWLKQAHPTETKVAYTPNHFFEYFNCGFNTEKPPYALGTDPNGGFRLTVLRDDLNVLEISKIMCDDMGLNAFMNFDGVTFKKNQTVQYLMTMIPVDVNFLPAQDFSGNADFRVRVLEGDIAQFSIYDTAAQQVTGPLRADTPPLTIIQNNIDQVFYQFLNLQPKFVTESTISQGTVTPTVNIDDKGEYVYRYTNPKIGSYISNDATVSIGGFSMFSDIRIVVPVGVIFNPMLSGRSDARILAEMRLPYSNTASVVQGMGPAASPEGLIMSTNSSFFGDVIWNSISSKQYLKVTSQNPIYEILCEIRLVYRDQTIEPKVLYLGYNDVFDLKLRLLQTQ